VISAFKISGAVKPAFSSAADQQQPGRISSCELELFRHQSVDEKFVTYNYHFHLQEKATIL
jgi:hypothetical protein